MADRLAELAGEVLLGDARASRTGLCKLGFTDVDRVGSIIDRLGGSTQSPAVLPLQILVAAATSGRPDQALGHFERFAQASGGHDLLYRRLDQSDRLREFLLKILAHSSLLTDILVRNPEYLFWLFEETPFLTRELDKPSLREIIWQDTGSGRETEDVLTGLRRAQRRELLRIGAAEILGLKSVEQTGRELAELADVVLELTLETCVESLIEKLGQPRNPRDQPAEFCIVGLGKYGGVELNYSSDIDLLFVYDEDGSARSPAAGEGMDQGRGIENAEFFTRLGEMVISSLTEVTSEGFLYRVDMRLRPEGRHSPLARSVGSYWIHYETRGELWERQMLIKARLAAGSEKLWRRFEQMLRPFVYPARFSVSPHEEIRRVKQRIEAEIQPGSGVSGNIKLCPGGIRDIEFVVQCLQLLSGRLDHSVRSVNTLEAIAKLREAGSLDDGEAEELTQAYCFLRRLENLLQIETDRPVYELPESEEARDGLASAMGAEGVEDSVRLEKALEGHLQRVREVYDNLFYGHQEESEELSWLLDAPAASPRVDAVLDEMGFGEPASVHGVLIGIASSTLMTQVGRQRLGELLPELLASLAAAPDPEAATQRLAQLMAAYGAPTTLTELMQWDPNFRKMIVSICGSSQYLADLMCRDPSLLDALVTGGATWEAQAPEPADLDPGAVSRFRNREVLRIGTEDLLKLASSEETFTRLSEVADMAVRIKFKEAWRVVVRRRGKPRTGKGGDAVFACIAAGKYGSSELNFGSDLDLIFVYDGEGSTGKGVDNQQFFGELAVELSQLLSEIDYEVDARLRPEGRRAPMVISLAGYRRYLKNRAGTWERMALTRARGVAGDTGLGEKVLRAIRGFVYDGHLEEEAVREMRHIRTRMEPTIKRGQTAGVDIKKGPGGIVDVEFVAQILAVKYGKEHGFSVGMNTRQLLDRLIGEGLIARGEGSILLDAHERLRDVEKAFRMTGNRPRKELPEGRELTVLARALGEPDGDRLKSEIADQMKRTREILEGVFGRFAVAPSSISST